MPATRLVDQLAVQGKTFDVLGVDSVGRPEYVSHVGLLAGDVLLNNSMPVHVAHMRPPMGQSEQLDRVHSIGSLPLNQDQRNSISVFLRSVASELAQADKLDQYVALPHARPADDEHAFRRFSCAGLVVEAYAEAGIPLLEVAQLPAVDLETLLLAFPSARIDGLRHRIGLENSGPWPVLLPGYVLNSLDRPREAIIAGPYQAQPGDEFFPSSRATESSVRQDS